MCYMKFKITFHSYIKVMPLKVKIAPEDRGIDQDSPRDHVFLYFVI